ncbi:MogA/MoaB family molybdenum cofactor biosynthesis protein [Thermoflexus sp.]|uniref:MogA/MoaB family molybdenum cofactor biosynthesis protein n=1 Tax=Thermoflexus sp. TaxID=1969742 RepID=UPI0025D02B87|nr:MogA/MoaB family molybdenum cofactor biosynthesis protein [Thermoflexus sp.]MDW8180565.1 MogA/MoaB family molybdenum cofactor biosynthesis protein [Anaerolineae bacterium]MCS6964164.1 MogA/MoaB family molybdenum cofactor biosynthesis protein [Thermoflexus sp.]MCS7351112.1 MogA/MoaB family molybdenum cofactor biosynthesis protein [Thermoflexus sp.]MCX7689883.1 MogA/MoaB family molybdenum cofactor biosynthesis protein [Thermoflexus sp.]MDW8185693.1 MogA/MoaB family molybdenum cofactor biosynt
METVRVGILTISDRAAHGIYPDESGAILRKRMVEEMGWTVAQYAVVPDEIEAIQRTLRAWCDEEGLDLILTTGGTGLGPRDLTPEATRPLLEREAPGIAEALRFHSLQHTPFAMLSRGIAGVRRRTLIINLPGSPRAVQEAMDLLGRVLPHAIAMLRGEAHPPTGHVLRA